MATARSAARFAAPLEYRKPSLIKALYRYRYMLMLMLPGIVYFVVFHYVPIYGAVLAFKDYDVHQGIVFSP